MDEGERNELVWKALTLLGVPQPRPCPDWDAEFQARTAITNNITKVRAVASVDPIVPVQPGSQVTWDSPLFGRLTGTVTAVCVEGFLEVQHPLTEVLTTIPLSWVVRREATP